ncbi:MAG: flagellar biosynthetic protein FliR [candidate division Zixibacteria bacterium]|nr:flagellar biosynthetic protein FliR [candidate division Zixibacteria bacterium]
MFDFINFGADKLQILLLILVRTSGVVAIAPVFSDTGIPKLIRVALVLLLSMVLVPVLGDTVNIPVAESVWQLTGYVLNELLVGVIIGLMFKFIFIAVLTAGSLIGYQIGFMMANLFDKSLNTQVSLIGRFWHIIAILLFLAINGHHLIINAFAESYLVIPPGAVGLYGSAGELIIKYSAYIFVIALKVAAPVMVSLFLIDVSLGTIAKTMPTMNVFFVGFPIKIGAGLMVMAMALPIFAYVMERALEYFDRGLADLLMVIGRA